MAILSFDRDDLLITLSASEQLMSFQRSFRVPRAQVISLRWSDNLWRELPPWNERGWRIGTGLPGLAIYGRMKRRDGTHFVCIGWRPASGAVIEFTADAPFRSVITQCPLTIAEPAPAR